MRFFLALLLCAIAFPVAAEQTGGIIVKLKPSAAKAALTPASRLARVADGAGVPLRHVRTLATGADLAALPAPVDADQARALAARIAADPDVQYAEPNWRAHAAALANDEFFNAQGY